MKTVKFDKSEIDKIRSDKEKIVKDKKIVRK